MATVPGSFSPTPKAPKAPKAPKVSKVSKAPKAPKARKVPLTAEEKKRLGDQTELLLDLQALSVKNGTKGVPGQNKYSKRSIKPVKYQGEDKYNTVEFDISLAFGSLKLVDQDLLKLPHEELGDDLDNRLKNFGLGDFTETKFNDSIAFADAFDKDISSKDILMERPLLLTGEHPAFEKSNAWDGTYLEGLFSHKPDPTKVLWLQLLVDDEDKYPKMDLEEDDDAVYIVGDRDTSLSFYAIVLHAIPELVNSFFLNKKAFVTFDDAETGQKNIPHKYLLAIQKVLSESIKRLKQDSRELAKAAACMNVLAMNYDLKHKDLKIESVGDLKTNHKDDLEILKKLLLLNGVGIILEEIDDEGIITGTYTLGDETNVIQDAIIQVENYVGSYIRVSLGRPFFDEKSLPETKKFRRSTLNRFYGGPELLIRTNNTAYPNPYDYDVGEVVSGERIAETVEKRWTIDTPVEYEIRKIRAKNGYD